MYCLGYNISVCPSVCLPPKYLPVLQLINLEELGIYHQYLAAQYLAAQYLLVVHIWQSTSSIVCFDMYSMLNKIGPVCFQGNRSAGQNCSSPLMRRSLRMGLISLIIEV